MKVLSKATRLATRQLPIVWFLIFMSFPLMAFSLWLQTGLPDFTDFPAVLVWLTGVGAPFVVGYAMSWILENWEFWHTLPPRVKFAAPMVLSVLLSIGARYLLQEVDVIGAISPYWTMIVSAILIWLGSQRAYLTAHKQGYPPTVRAQTKEYDFGE
jgi:hypothetical protein